MGDFYTIDGVRYDSHFPEEWAKDHKTFMWEDDGSLSSAPSGPDCGNCLFYGSCNGVFVGYCSNCAREYNFTRGKGFCFDYTEEEMWKSLEYMKGVPFHLIGEHEERPELYEYEASVYEYKVRNSKTFNRSKQKNPLKKGAKRAIRRKLRNRVENAEYLGIPENAENETIEITSFNEIFCILLAILFLYFIWK